MPSDGATLKFLECDQTGFLSDETLENAITDKTRLVAIAQVSNVLGRTAPIEKIVKLARKHGAVVVMDAAQSAPHMPINVKDLEVDFMAFSGHKLMGPMASVFSMERKSCWKKCLHSLQAER